MRQLRVELRICSIKCSRCEAISSILFEKSLQRYRQNAQDDKHIMDIKSLEKSLLQITFQVERIRALSYTTFYWTQFSKVGVYLEGLGHLVLTKLNVFKGLEKFSLFHYKPEV